jgi:hypothetical protein
MNDIRADQLATIHRLASDFIAKLEADGFHRSAIASVLTALGINLATSCNDPGALALVIEAALREMSPRREKANSLMKKSALDGCDPVSVEELSNELGRARAAERPDDRSKGEEDEVAVERVQYQAAASGTPPPSETPPPSADPPAPAAAPQPWWRGLVGKTQTGQ